MFLPRVFVHCRRLVLLPPIHSVRRDHHPGHWDRQDHRADHLLVGPLHVASVVAITLPSTTITSIVVRARTIVHLQNRSRVRSRIRVVSVSIVQVGIEVLVYVFSPVTLTPWRAFRNTHMNLTRYDTLGSAPSHLWRRQMLPLPASVVNRPIHYNKTAAINSKLWLMLEMKSLFFRGAPARIFARPIQRKRSGIARKPATICTSAPTLLP